MFTLLLVTWLTFQAETTDALVYSRTFNRLFVSRRMSGVTESYSSVTLQNCAMKCFRDPSYVGFNFDGTTGICEIVANPSGGNFIGDAKFNYYIINDLDPCYARPCLNGGICTVSDNGQNYSCNCTDSFFGFNCESDGAECDTICVKRGSTTYNFYNIEGYDKTWSQTNDFCSSKGMSMVMIKTNSTFEFLKETLHSYKSQMAVEQRFWYGLNRTSTLENWMWVDGTVGNFDGNYWLNGVTGSDLCVGGDEYSNFAWNDDPCNGDPLDTSYKYYPLCQREVPKQVTTDSPIDKTTTIVNTPVETTTLVNTPVETTTLVNTPVETTTLVNTPDETTIFVDALDVPAG